MKYATKIAALAAVICWGAVPAYSELRSQVLRDAALDAGLVPAEQLLVPFSEEKSAAGRLLFESKRLSLNSDMACKTCHLDRFSSADGLPNAVGVDGEGEGPERLATGGMIVPRNTLPLWGRGAPDFPILFWDGKVEQTASGLRSQFGEAPPSDDPLLVAVHLPFVEIREMVKDDEHVAQEFEKEEVEAAHRIYAILAERVRNDDELGEAVSSAFDVPREEIEFAHVAESVVHFIRDRFRVRETRLHRFVFDREELSQKERRGGLLFYGKGRCTVCHAGPLFTDFRFHAIPFPQAGFGKNGFGVDYGRYNVTFDDLDLYKFRTPPLFNVSATAPYSHSGSVADLGDAIRYHFDPLRFHDGSSGDLVWRVEFYKRLSSWAGNELKVPVLNDAEVDALVAFLDTLSFQIPGDDLSSE